MISGQPSMKTVLSLHGDTVITHSEYHHWALLGWNPAAPGWVHNGMRLCSQRPLKSTGGGQFVIYPVSMLGCDTKVDMVDGSTKFDFM